VLRARPSPILLQSVSANTLALAGVGCLCGLAFGTAEGWPLWVIGLAALLPWVPVLTRDVAWVYQRYGWLAPFYLLVITQTGHFFEHVAQMIQIHVLALQGADARGIFGTLDIEWVHFVWNSWVIIAVVVLLSRFGDNRWLRLTAFLSGWHEIEHIYIFWVYMHTGTAGLPGLLAQGGAIAGGLPLTRPDLHFLYNLIETVPLLLGFFVQVQRTQGTQPGLASAGSRNGSSRRR